MNTTIKTSATTLALVAAAKFHSLANTASRYGGMWVSAAGGTANVAAGEIARGCGVSFEEAHRALDATAETVGSDADEWYRDLHSRNRDVFEDARWDARTIAKAAVRSAIAAAMA